ncbi:MAG TPA: protein kinase, partial [Vicinamibacterales bacterium]|nr:protein kinase [Vicinamibacterales bacterium]
MLHQIGNGALGPVFRAYDSDRDRLVAIKVFRLDLPPERVHQLVAEFEKLIGTELQHPVIAAPRATGIDGGNNAFLAQDFAAADSLDIVMRENGPTPVTRALRLASQLAEALDYAADRQILHGALHPRDVLLSEDDIRIAGLGVSRALERVGVAIPVRRPYSAPERINDEGWDRRADVFSLAAIFYELLCGRRVAGTGSDAAESLTHVAGCDMAKMQRVLALALAADPEYRFTSATAFTNALQDAVASTGRPDDVQGSTVSPPKPKAKRQRAKLRVIAPVQHVPDEMPDQGEQPDLELSIRDDSSVADADALPLLEFAPESADAIAFADDPPRELVSEPDELHTDGRRTAPAPTPVAIETVASSSAMVEDLFDDAPDLSLAVESTVERETGEYPPVEFAVVEQPELSAFADVPEEAVATEEAPSLLDLRPEDEPPRSHEPLALPDEPRLPAFLNPEAPLLHVEPSRSHSPVWPIGVAAVIGIAVGFGVGYTIAIRDRGVAAPVAVAQAPPAAVATPVQKETAAVPVSSPPVADTSAATAPPKPRNEDNPAPLAPAVPFEGQVLVRSTPSGARVFVDGKDR